jgi:hypothetical protein
MSGYTKGPWIQNPTNISIATAPYDEGGRQVSFVQGVSNKEQARANARLIAAAPELLESLKGVLGEESECEGQSNGNVASVLRRTNPALVDLAEAAIAKAEAQ